MLKRLDIGKCKISKNYISVLDVYCSETAKKNLRCNSSEHTKLFDKITQIAMNDGEQTYPTSLPNFSLVERNEFYGINDRHLSLQKLAESFELIYRDASIELLKSRVDEEQLLKDSFFRPVCHIGQVGKEFQLKVRPGIVLDLTKRLRAYFPEELFKKVTSHN